MTDLMDVLHVHDASIATTMSLPAHSSRSVVNLMESALVRLALVAMTAPSRYAAHWQMERIGHLETDRLAIVRRAGRGSTATSATPIRPVMP